MYILAFRLFEKRMLDADKGYKKIIKDRRYKKVFIGKIVGEYLFSMIVKENRNYGLS